MLQSLNPSEIAVLKKRPGTPIDSFVTAHLKLDQIVRFFTSDGSCYLLEMVNPRIQLAHIVVCKPDSAVSSLPKYCGVQRISPQIRKEYPVEYGDSRSGVHERTAPVNVLFLLL